MTEPTLSLCEQARSALVHDAAYDRASTLALVSIAESLVDLSTSVEALTGLVEAMGGKAAIDRIVERLRNEAADD